MEFTGIYDMVDEMNEIAERTVRNTMEPCKATDLGLDSRAGYALFVNEDCIAVNGDGHMLDYYGGFEYVDKEYVRVVGDWKFYFADDQRVQEHICIYFAEQETAEDEKEAA
jgi:hypothetical protein